MTDNLKGLDNDMLTMVVNLKDAKEDRNREQLIKEVFNKVKVSKAM